MTRIEGWEVCDRQDRVVFSIQSGQLFRCEERGAGESIHNEVGFSRHPADLEGEHCYFFTQTLKTRAGEVEDVLLKNSLEWTMVCVGSK